MNASPATRPLIAILELYTMGHHRMYLAAYIASMLAAGKNLIVLTPNAHELEARLLEEYQIDEKILKNRIFLESIPLTSSISKLPTYRLMSSLGRWHYAQIIKSILRRAESRAQQQAEKFYLACIYEFDARITLPIIRSIALPWSALYLFADTLLSPKKSNSRNQKSLDSLLHCPRLQGLFTLDESLQPVLREKFQKPVFVVPDITQTQIAKTLAFPEITSRIKHPLVGMFGYLRPAKGLLTLAQTILLPEAQAYHFLIAGEIPWDAYSEEQAEIIRQALAQSNVTAHIQRIPSESQYNALFSQCDVIFAAYHQFPHSSNSLTKASHFRIPILVSEGGLMAKRVREFQLGECVREADPHDTLRGIQTILQRDFHDAKCEEFNALHSLPRLQEILENSRFF